MSDGRAVERSHPDSPGVRSESSGLVSTIVAAGLGVFVASTVIDSAVYTLTVAALAGGCAGALVSVTLGLIERTESNVARPASRAERDPAPSGPGSRSDEEAPADGATSQPWFHRSAGALSLGLATVLLLVWGLELEAVRAGYAAATATGLLSYAVLASTLPRW